MHWGSRLRPSKRYQTCEYLDFKLNLESSRKTLDLKSSHFSGFDCDLESFESILDFVNLAANSITSIIGASIAGIGSRATGRIAGTGMMTVAGGL